MARRCPPTNRPARWFPLLVCALLVVGAPGLEAQEAPSDAPKPDAETTPEADSAAEETTEKSEKKDNPPSPSSRKLLAEAGEIADRVAEIRGLRVKRSIDKGIKTREQLRETLVEKLAEEQSKKEMAREAAVFRKLGLIPEDLDYREMILDVLTEQIAGFYDQKTEELNIMEGIPLSLQRPAMAHELFHAIQDQHFNLEKMLSSFSAQENGDFSLARSALVEGDATVLMIDFSFYERGTLPKEGVRSVIDIPRMAHMLSQLNFENMGALEQLQPPGGKAAEGGPAPGLSDSALSKAPSIIQRALIFPYFSGMRFVIAMRRGRSWESFNEIYANPPVSTEQILHPKRYAYGDEPVLLDYQTGPALEEWTSIYDTVLGEFQMRLFLDQHLGATEETPDATSGEESGDTHTPPTPAEAAKGWDGDRLMAFESPDGRVLVTHLSAWDSTDEAREYRRALEATARKRFPEASATQSSGKHGEGTCLRVPSDSEKDAPSGGSAERVCIQRWGDLVLHVEGAPTALDAQGRETDATAFRLTRHIWESVDRTPLREELERRQKSATSESDAENGD